MIQKASRDWGVLSDKEQSKVVFSTDPADFYYARVNVPCQGACPAGTNVPAYIRAIYEQRFGRSYELNRMVNLLPGVLGRICSRPCETSCRHGERELGKPVNICHLKRSAADFKETGHIHMESLLAPLGKSVAVIGAGPAGLAAAHDLSTIGFSVTVFEAMDKPGGMLLYGIPEFRLPRDVLKGEVDSILRLGVNLKTNMRMGRDISMNELLSDYDAVLVAAGCYVSQKLQVPGETLDGVFSGLEFVMDVNAGKAPEVGNTVVVIGAGFTAFDCARTALRLGARNVSICIRGLEEDLRVTEDEIVEAKREGVKIRALMVSKNIVGTNRVGAVEFVRTRPGPILPGGKREITSIEGSDFSMECDSVIAAIGQTPEPLRIPGQLEDSLIKADPSSFRTSVHNLYLTGDFMTGPSTVIESIAGGRRAAERIAQDLMGRNFREWVVRIEDAQITDRDRAWDYIPRYEVPSVIPVQDRFTPPGREVETGLPLEDALEEAKRCYLCYLHYEIDISRCIYCRFCIDVAPRDCIKLVEDVVLNEDGAIASLSETNDWSKVNAVVIDNSRCIRCGQCVRVCPVNCISVSKVELVERISVPE